jgi:phosphomannomutase
MMSKVKASNTQPVLVLRFEADSEKRLEQIREEVYTVVDHIISAGNIFPNHFSA